MIVVVGGHSRNIGKTSAMCSIIRQTASLNWTAIKITQFGHGACSEDGADCGCAPKSATHPYALDEQRDADNTDSGRYLAAGARVSFWLRTRQRELAEAMPVVRGLLDESANTILESNSVMAFLQPDLYIVVIDPRVDDFKTSARMQLTRADAVIRTGPGSLPRQLQKKPVFDGWDPPGLGEWVLQTAGNRRTTVTR